MKNLKKILEELRNNELTIEQAEKMIKVDYLDSIDEMSQLDFTRHTRTGIPEVIFAQSKPLDSLEKIVSEFLEKNEYCFLTRVTEKQKARLKDIYLGDKFGGEVLLKENKLAQTLFIHKKSYSIHQKKDRGAVGIITAGTSDVPIAEEAKVLLNIMGIQTQTAYDVGIAGFHRIFHPIKNMIEDSVSVIIVVAGMEGTLPGVVSALVDVPVIGVPTSTGYGMGEKGTGALTTMLQSCSPGLSVVNIDNGFGAAASAALIALQIEK